MQRCSLNHPGFSFSALLTDTDGSETLHLSIGALPVGSTLSDGTHTVVTSAGQSTVDITGWAMGQLRLTIPSDQVGDFTLTVTASAVEASNGDTASTTSTMNIHVVAQAPVISSASSANITIVSGSGGTANASSGIVIDWGGTLISLLTGTPVHTNEWVSDLLCPPRIQHSLGEQTGLVVRIE